MESFSKVKNQQFRAHVLKHQDDTFRKQQKYNYFCYIFVLYWILQFTCKYDVKFIM